MTCVFNVVVLHSMYVKCDCAAWPVCLLQFGYIGDIEFVLLIVILTPVITTAFTALF